MVRPVLRLALLALGLLAALAPARAADRPAPDPLRLVPDAADLIVKVEQPTRLLDLAVQLASMQELQAFPGYRDYFESTNYRRFRQLVAYFEKELGKPWHELVDELAGGGGVFALKFRGDMPVLLGVVQGKNPELVKKFADLALTVAEQELARLEVKERPRKEKYRGVEVVRVGAYYHAAVLDGAIIASNAPRAIEAAIDLHLDKSPKSILTVGTLTEARKLLPADPLAWAWLNLDPLHRAEGAKPLFELPGDQPQLHILYGGYFDVLKRAPFVAAAFTQERHGPVLTIRLPKGTQGMHEAMTAHTPPDGTGLLPLLEPKGTLYTTSYYMDVVKFWELRAKLFNPAQLAGVEQFEKESARYLLGTRFSKLLRCVGPRQRLVVARQYETGYATKPQTRLPAFAWVIDLREPEAFAKAIEPPLRSLGLLASFGADMTLFEEKHGGWKIVGYRFVENDKNKANTNGILFNFSPCFVRVGDQFVFSSTLELARTLADEIDKQAKAPKAHTDSAAVRSRFHWDGLAAYFDAIRDQLVTATILGDGSPPDEAKNQVELLIEFLNRLGSVELTTVYEPERFRYDIRIRPPAK